MNDKNSQIIDVMESLSGISQENAAGTQEASATVEEVANASEELAKLAQDLKLEMDYFKIQ